MTPQQVKKHVGGDKSKEDRIELISKDFEICGIGATTM